MAHWHALAKLRLHTDLTLEILDQTTTLLGEYLRAFHQKTCSAFDTKELPKETDARERRKLKTKTTTKAKAKKMQKSIDADSSLHSSSDGIASGSTAVVQPSESLGKSHLYPKFF